jgi:phenylacetate-CoA ligase
MSPVQALKEKIDALFMRRKFIPAFEMTEESIQRLIATIEKFKPVLMDGYAESLNLISLVSSTTATHSPKAVMSSAQQLTDLTIGRIESQFGAKVLDKYGSREFSGIAYQCLNSANHHVQDESYIIEILVDGRIALPGEIGEVVITDLNNFSMPLIRYRIGDLAKAVKQEACSCGRSHKQIGEITGRTQALIACKNGVWLPGTFFAHFFKDYDFAIRHYQVMQEKVGGFEVRVVPNYQFNESLEGKIIRELHTYAGQETLIKVVLVDEIPLLKTGKRTPVISRVPYDFQDIGESNLISHTDVSLSDED